MRKNLHAVLLTVSTIWGDPLSPLLKCTTYLSLCSQPLFGLSQCSASINKCQWVPFSPHGGVQWHTFASYTLPCQTVTLLPSVTLQENIMEYWQEGSSSTTTPPTSTPDITDQHNEIGGVTFEAALIPAWLKLLVQIRSGIRVRPSPFFSSKL